MKNAGPTKKLVDVLILSNMLLKIRNIQPSMHEKAWRERAALEIASSFCNTLACFAIGFQNLLQISLKVKIIVTEFTFKSLESNIFKLNI